MSNRQHQVALLLLLAPFIAVSQVLSLNASRERDLHAFDDARFIAHLDARIPELMEDQGIPGVGIFLIKILTNSQRNWPFFAQILEDWSRWRGFGPVGMSRIVPAQAAMRTIIGWILLASLWCVWRIGQGVSTGNRRPSLGKASLPGLGSRRSPYPWYC